MKLLKTTFLTALLAMFTLAVAAQMQDPVHFKVSQKKVSPTELEVIFTGRIDKGWHVYSTGLPADGPISATLHTEKAEGVKAAGKLSHRGKEISQFDKMFGMNLRYFENSVTFVQKFKIVGKTYKVSGYLEYGACNDENCIPPTQVEFAFNGEGPADAPEAEETTEAEATDTTAAAAMAGADSLQTDTAAVNAQGDLWKPVIDELQNFNGGDTGSSRSWIYIFLMGLVGGFVALFTPCVWPIIPMTVSFFLKRTKDKKKGIRDAITYGISIIVIYLALGLAITAIFGASSLNALATNAVFNIFFCLLLVVFALSFFGWFELTLPSSWTNKVDNKASSTSGMLSIFLMAFTLTLVSFSCTGPIIGFLLVEVSTSGSIAGPAIGMLGFAIALALPFTLFALFPTWLKQAPKSGSWMNTIKIVLGFIELAFALKFFSVADLAYGWGLLDREVFLALWIIIFGMLGLYLIGKLKFPSDQGNTDAMPVPCIVLGMISLAFTVYLIPGLWGAPCKAVSAFAPPINTQDFNLYHNEVEPKYKDYEQGMAAAAAEGKPVVVDFTGFGCVNCRKMEAAVWTDPQVADKLNNDFILISLYVDDKQPLDKPIEVVENGRKRKLRTVGDKWSYLQRSKFGANAQPFYVILDNKGMPVAGSYSYDENIGHYTDFLNTGLKNYKK
ncbi:MULTISPECIES: protein-disulfide reductase DsbD family protein [Prevotellaceae]|jgi:thiol:disulfide interchange protein|uniref:Thiol:disulfide interchange protein n=2 Tax=Prevotellaceae TaxID=171552 RepID=A0A8E1QXV9_9BACT|nr:thiol:disulfide interchange protein [Xylanibacter rarus]MBS5874901.1 thioredoxin family protein [Prevotella sp.]CCX69472.1 putative thiol:disulfide interchange protein DsbD [Prevotella sp. CAG:255]